MRTLQATLAVTLALAGLSFSVLSRADDAPKDNPQAPAAAPADRLRVIGGGPDSKGTIGFYCVDPEGVGFAFGSNHTPEEKRAFESCVSQQVDRWIQTNQTALAATPAEGLATAVDGRRLVEDLPAWLNHWEGVGTLIQWSKGFGSSSPKAEQSPR